MLQRLILRQRYVHLGVAAAVILGAVLLAAIIGRGLWFTTVLVGVIYVTAGVVRAARVVRSRWGRGVTSKSSPLWRQAAAYGEPGDVLAAIDAEVAAGHDVRVFGHAIAWEQRLAPDLVLLTPTWFVRATRAGLTVIRLDDVLWVFRFSRRGHSPFFLTYPFLLPYRTQGFRLCLSAEEVQEIPIGDPATADAVLDEIVRRRPAALAGFDEPWRELLARGAGPMSEEIERRSREWSALDAAGRERWLAGQRQSLDGAAQFLSPRGRDKVRDAVDALARSRRDLTGAPPDRDAGISLAAIAAVERVRFAIAAVVAIAATIPLLLLAFGTFPRAGFDERVGIVVTTGTFLAIGWSTVAYRYVFNSPGRRLQRPLRRSERPLELIAEIDADLSDPATRWVYGLWPKGVTYSRPDFIALGATWLVQMRPAHAELVRLRDLVWVHERVVPKPVWWLGDRYRFELVGRLRDGSSVTIRADDEAELGEVLEELLERRPALLTGWRGDWLALAEQGAAAPAAAYDDRKRELAALPAEKREAWLDESWDFFQRFVEHAE